MLYELWKYWTTPCPKLVRQMGYLKELIAIETRYARNRHAWENHLQNSKNFILKNIPFCSQHSTVCVLGSGLLLDVPLIELSALFNKVILIDIIHLPLIRKKTQKFSNVELIEKDVSGILAAIEENPGKIPHDIETPELPSCDLVISLNLISQLPLLPLNFLGSLWSSPEEKESFIKNVIEKHRQLLEKMAPCQCIITEKQQIYRDIKGNIIENYETFQEKTFPAAEESWIWEVAPQGELSSQYSLEGEVHAYFLKKGNHHAL